MCVEKFPRDRSVDANKKLKSALPHALSTDTSIRREVSWITGSKNVCTTPLREIVDANRPKASRYSSRVDRYLLQKDGKVVEWREEKLRRKLRGRDLTGLELIRHGEDEHWRPLHELAMFREEVPHLGDPGDVARRRVARGFMGHLLGYAVATTFVFGAFSIPSMIWGLFVLGHAARALPAIWTLVRSGRLLSAGLPGAAIVATKRNALPRGTGAAPVRSAVSPFDADLEDVRAMLDRRDRDLSAPMIEELERVACTVHELRDKIERLSALLDDEHSEGLQEQREAANAALAATQDPKDRALRRRQLEVLRDREAAETRAHRVLDRLRLRESLACQQVRQLRLDLVASEASALEPDDLGVRLEQIRLEAEAAEEVEHLLARPGS